MSVGGDVSGGGGSRIDRFGARFLTSMIAGNTVAETVFRVGDHGMPFDVVVVDGRGAVLDVSAATTARFAFRKPGGEVIVRDAQIVADGGGGLLRHRWDAEDLDLPGRWSFQLLLEIDGESKRGEIIKFRVLPNISTGV